MKKVNKRINLYFILADENLFHPYYLESVVKALDINIYQVVGVTVAKAKYSRSFMEQMINLWGIKGFLAIGILSVAKSFTDAFSKKKRLLKSFAIANGTPYYESSNVNNFEHIQYLKQKDIDIIISSNGHIFKKELLDLPRIACINRHTALLPKYGGVLPVFWAMLFKEKYFGVSIHYMIDRIDQGKVITQKKILLNEDNSLFKNYIIGFKESVTETIKALYILEKTNKKSQKSTQNVDYYSFPTGEQFSRFRNQCRPFNLGDIQFYFKMLW